MDQTLLHKLIASYHTNIQRYGWVAIGVAAGENFGTFTYSGGFEQTMQHPEVLIVKLPPEIAHDLLRLIYAQIKTGTRFEPGTTYDSIAEGFGTRFVPITMYWKQHLMIQTYNIYKHWNFQALQLLFPDKRGHFPDDPLCNHTQAAWPLLNQNPPLAEPMNLC